MNKNILGFYNKIILITAIIVISFSCGNDKTKDASSSNITDAKSISSDEGRKYKRSGAGIMVEDISSSNTDPERYNKDNMIYKTGRSFIFDYTYKDKSGKQFYFEVPDQSDMNNWRLIPFEKTNKNTIKQFRMVVQQGLEPYIDRDPNFNMSIVGVEFMMDNDFMEQKLLTLLVENEKNTWLTPPRNFLFEVLELSPYPFMLYPPDQRRPWRWDRKISDRWSKPNRLEWKGRLDVSYKYAHHGHKLMRTPLGEIRCYDIHAMAVVGDKQQVTKLDFIYNEEFGFISMDYLNIDSSTLLIKLAEVQEN